MKNSLLIQANGVDKILSAQEYVASNQAFLTQLCSKTPWLSPFSVCGSSPRYSNVAIKEDFSDFEEMSNLALSDIPKNELRNVGLKDCQDLLPTTYRDIGFTLSYIDAFGIRRRGERCSISIQSPSLKDGLSNLKIFSLILPSTPKQFRIDTWLMPNVINSIIDMYRNAFLHCVSVTVTTNHLLRGSKEGNLEFGFDAYKRDNPSIAPITYFGNAKVVEILNGEPDMQPYGEGLLLRLTDDIFGAEQRLDIVQRLHAISMKLRSAGIRFLEDGINRADWGCDSSSVLQGEPEVWPEHRRG